VPLDTDLGFPSNLAFASAKFVTRHRRAAVLETKTSLDRAALVGEWWLAMRAAVLLTVLIATAAAATDPPATCGFGAGALPVDTLPPGTPHRRK